MPIAIIRGISPLGIFLASAILNNTKLAVVYETREPAWTSTRKHIPQRLWPSLERIDKFETFVSNGRTFEKLVDHVKYKYGQESVRLVIDVSNYINKGEGSIENAGSRTCKSCYEHNVYGLAMLMKFAGPLLQTNFSRDSLPGMAIVLSTNYVESTISDDEKTKFLTQLDSTSNLYKDIDFRYSFRMTKTAQLALCRSIANEFELTKRNAVALSVYPRFLSRAKHPDGNFMGPDLTASYIFELITALSKEENGKFVDLEGVPIPE
ncbi:9968_t:CDS:2 [Paraglomus brasilianum]|uniref:9968_t:CDS:1 n=1 Tax=Paraglomus brasilianum TaxID=144538 RepID=A0A9N9FLT4_9GLOM|nr:9968_t:CDS:2 [Paraglomus brasilianum]